MVICTVASEQAYIFKLIQIYIYIYTHLNNQIVAGTGKYMTTLRPFITVSCLNTDKTKGIMTTSTT